MVDIYRAGGGSILTVAETEVFSDTAPESWTDLNLSGTVGAQATLVVLKISGTTNNRFAVRRNGDTDEFYYVGAEFPMGCATFQTTANVHGVLLVATDASGLIEWISESNPATTIDVIAYIK